MMSKEHHSEYIESGLTVRPIAGKLGAEVSGIKLLDISSHDHETIRTIYKLMLRHKVIFFREQNLSPEQHEKFASFFGDIHVAHPLLPSKDGYPNIFEIDYTIPGSQYPSYENGSNTKYQDHGVAWHTDITFTEEPPKCSILNGVIIPYAGGDTMWSDQVLAFSTLSNKMKDMLRGCYAIHDASEFAHSGINAVSRHPVVIRHPETGEESLFVHKGFTRRIVDLSKPESDMILSFLYEHSTRYEFTVRYRWTQGDIAFADNRVTQHAVVGDIGRASRLVNRVTLKGEKPIPAIQMNLVVG
jgi:taurine dioxygenase